LYSLACTQYSVRGTCSPPFQPILTFLCSAGGQTSSETLQAVKDYGANSVSKSKEIFSAEEKKVIARKPRYAITSSVQTGSFTAMAVMLGYSIQKHNDLKAMDAELVLLVRAFDPKDDTSVTAENITRLEKAGWKVRVAQELEFEGVDTGDIRSWHRHNLNKLHLWSWTEYEKILFIDADVVCKGSLAELWDMPGDFAAAPDVWWNILVDNRFNSGVIVFRPSMETFHDMVPKVSDPNYHSPNDADQAFLNAYYKFRYFGLPYKYNFNLVMVWCPISLAAMYNC
jgi:alpha-N-acetylglucosamine transferase